MKGQQHTSENAFGAPQVNMRFQVSFSGSTPTCGGRNLVVEAKERELREASNI